MKKAFILFGLLIGLMTTAMAQNSFHDFTITTLEGEDLPLADLKGRKVLVVNTASKCGYTPQYDDLQKFHEQYGEDVVVIGFPANNFGGQEPGSNSDIRSFCQKNYGVTFPMSEKVSVKGADRHPLFTWLAQQDINGKSGNEPQWNFSKYLIDEDGQVVGFYASGVNPFDEEFLTAAELE
jgi:glutathione peroxidase